MIRYLKYWINEWYKYLFTKQVTRHKPIDKDEYKHLCKISVGFAKSCSSFGLTSEEAAKALKALNND